MKRYLFFRMVVTGVAVVLLGFGVNAFAETGRGPEWVGAPEWAPAREWVEAEPT